MKLSLEEERGTRKLFMRAENDLILQDREISIMAWSNALK